LTRRIFLLTHQNATW